MRNHFQILLLLTSLLLSFSVRAQDMGELGSIACQGQGPECQENIVTEQDLKNPADKGTMKLVSAGASLLYMGGVLNGVIKLPAFMGDVAKICASSGLMVAANLLAFMNARGNGKKIKAELAAIKEEAKQLQEKLENDELRRSKEFQIEVFDFYMRSMERLQKITQLRIKQHGKNSSYYSIAMSVGIAEAIIYSLPWSSNPPMAKCGAKSAIFAGIALAMEKKGQGQANKLLDEYTKRWGILAEIKGRLMIGTQSLAKADGDLNSGPRSIIGTDVNGGGRVQGAGRDWEAYEGGLSVSGSEYGCVNGQAQMDESCNCVATNSCYKSTTSSWGQSRYASAFSSAGLDGYINDMNSAFAGKNTDPSTLSMASINQRNASAARLRDRLLKDYEEKERNSKKKFRLGDKIGIASDKELAAFLNSNFKRDQLNDLFANNSDVFAGSDQIDLGPSDANDLAGLKNFDKGVEAFSNVGNGAAAGATDQANFGLANEPTNQDLMSFDPKNIVLPNNVDYDYVGNREDIVRNNGASLFEIISHRYQLIYREKPADL